jgi:HK97 family phage portal protein
MVRTMARSRRFLRSLPPPPAPPPGTNPPRPTPVGAGPAPANPVEAAIAAVLAQRARGYENLDPYALPVVVACRGLLADTLGQLPLITLRGRRPLPRQPTLTLRPNPGEYRWLTFHRMTNNLTRWGYTFLRVTDWTAAGNPAAVRVLDPSSASPVWDPVSGGLDTVWHNGEELTPGLDVMWVPYRVERAGSLGEAPLDACAEPLRLFGELFSMAGSYWETGFPSLIVEVAQRLAPGQAQAIKQQIIESMAGRHEPAVVDQDGKVSSIGSSAVEAQLVESIAVANAEIARAFLMPPSLVNVASGDSLTYSTVEGEMRRWLATGLGAYLNRFEAAFDDLTPQGQRTRFDTTELLRADLAGRVEAYSTALAGEAWLTVDEVRDLEGLDPLPDTPAAPAPEPSPTTLTDAVPGA